MNFNNIIRLLNNGGRPAVTVFGDFSLDKYLYVDSSKDELSLETNLTAWQVTDKRLFAGAGGTIVNNLLALGAKVYCVGIVGNDGEGYELLKCLKEAGADISGMVRTDDRFTGTYVKPMRMENDKATEMNRLDIKNFTKTPIKLQKLLIERLENLLDLSDAVIVSGQYTEPDCASITDYVREKLSELAELHNRIIWYVDSRSDIHKFKNLILKCNHKELAEIFNDDDMLITPDKALEYARVLYETNGKPVYVTIGEKGSVVYNGLGYKMPAFTVTGEIDVVGAGDACNAGIVYALAKGADYQQAGYVGNAASSVVIKKIGETGTASAEEVISILKDAVK